ncbi:phage tail tape measure protein [Butyrivibrio sp. MB2005]|uniref:phage tail tape measure protein n=1 Tax=Butyrivibrio sp. MB2005 TaxID=1280678 RepID=UPI0004132D49|nr:phage tail tape measure protein [Butyrivibrio sp. MB2005]
MADRLRGITVEIGGDTTKLSASLKQVNSDIRSTQSQLKDVNKLLKLDPGNSTLAAQQYRLLGDAIKETKEKLDALKEAEKQAKEALKNGDISQAQYDSLQREIEDTTLKLKDLEKQASKSGVALEKMTAVGNKMKDVGGSITNVGQKLMPVSAAVTGIGAAAVKTTADFDEAMSKVAAISGATGESFDALRDKAREMGSKTRYSAAESAESMTYMAMAGWKAEDMLDGIEGVMSLAAASGEDLATTSDIVTDALTAFGLSAKDSGHFADVLAAASSNANTNVSMMGETFKYAAPIAGALGFSVEDTAEAIGLMANAGIKSSMAGTSLRTIMNNLAGDVSFTGAAFGEMHIATTNADGSMRELSDILADCRTAFSQMSESEKAANAEALVGKNAMSGFLAIMGAGEADINKLSSAIANCDGTSQQMAETMQDNLSGQLTILKSQLQELAISLGDTMMPVIRKVVEHVQAFVDKLNSMDEGTKRTIITVGLIVAALAPVLIVVGKVITAVGTILTVIPKVISVVKLLSLTLTGGAVPALASGAASLGGIVVAARPVIAIIGAVVAAGVLLYKNWDTIKEKAGELKENVSRKWSEIKENTSKTWNNMTDNISRSADDMKSTVSQKLDRIKQAFSSNGNGIKTTISNLWTNIKERYSIGLDNINTLAENKLSGIKDSFRSRMSQAADAVRSAIDRIRGYFNFSWSLPKLKLPHFSISGSFSLDPPSVPSISVDWYKNGGILNGPTIFGMQNGRLLGGGEAGKEAVAPIETLKSYIADAVADGMRGQDGQIVSLLQVIANKDTSVYLDSGELVGGIAPKMDIALGNIAWRARRT